ncbi:hypothetical protein [Georgenia ruanii]|uniref:hypothetical protein n=1 Tax=Georgenia ruanii TaxID=348442 RepID=UPI0012649957|nr:hypothetical protein [Georgenia ruanii]
MRVVPLASHARWIEDPRGGGRGVRVSTHDDAGMVVLSMWRADECVATVRLRAEEAGELVAALAAALAHLADVAAPAQPRVC